jgi:ribosomal protein S18 acetylase RimI-like enzyme
MLWELRRLLLFLRTPAIYFKSLPEATKPGDMKCKFDAFSISRLEDLDDSYEKQISDALIASDFKPPFTIAEARQRLKKNELFLIISRDDLIAGWVWITLHRAHCDDLGCTFSLREGQAYAYNLFISKIFRGSGLASHLLLTAEHNLARMNINAVWAIVYDWNLSSQIAFLKAGYSKIGRCLALNILGIKCRLLPSRIRA